jgi:hypothetical protein
LVLGNLLMAILMRNELFLRFLYIISIYGLRSVHSPTMPSCRPCLDANQGLVSHSGRPSASSWP